MRKLARAVNPNLGRRKDLERRLKRAFISFGKDVLNDILLYLAQQDMLAEDKSLSNPKNPQERRKVQALMRKIDATIARDPETFRRDLTEFIDSHIAEWAALGDKYAEAVSVWYVKNCAADTTRSQRAGLIRAGVSPETFKRWKIPVISRQYVSPSAARIIPAIIQETASKITNICARDVNKITQAVVEGFSQGDTLGAVLRVVSGIEEMNADRAKFIARDQSNRITEQISIANDLDLGITEGVWIHRPGKYTSRETHIELDYSTFDLKTGAFDPAVGHNVMPGELINCRCVYRPVISKLLK